MVRQGSKPSAAVGICDFRGEQWDEVKKAERYAHGEGKKAEKIMR